MIVDRLVRSLTRPITGEKLINLLGGGTLSRSGKRVSARRALTYSPLWQGVSAIVGDVSKMRCVLYREGEAGREEARNHPVYPMTSYKPERRFPFSEWIKLVLTHAVLYGNGYAEVRRRNQRNRFVAFEAKWLHRDTVTPFKSRGEVWYRINPRAVGSQFEDDLDSLEEYNVGPDNMIHVKGLMLDELGGQSLIDFARNTIGRYLSAEDFTDDFFNNAAVPLGWFQTDQKLTDKAAETFLNGIRNQHTGKGRWAQGVLEQGMKFVPNGVSPKDALLLDLLAFGPKDVARFLNIPASKVGDSDRIAYKSLEEENKAYFTSSLCPWVCAIQTQLDDKLLSIDENRRRTHYHEFNTDDFFQPSFVERMDGYSRGILAGVYAPNEARRRENLPDYEGGDVYIAPNNYVPINMLGASVVEPELPEPDEPPEEDGGDNGDRSDVLVDAIVQRSLSVICVSAKRAAAKTVKNRDSQFLPFVDSLPEHRDKIIEILRPVASYYDDRVDDMASVLIDVAMNAYLRAAECSLEDLEESVEAASQSLREAGGQLICRIENAA